MREGGEEGGGGRGTRYRRAITWIARRRVTGGRHDVSCVSTMLDEIIKRSSVTRYSRIFCNEEFGLESNFGRKGKRSWFLIGYLCWIKIFDVFY